LEQPPEPPVDEPTAAARPPGRVARRAEAARRRSAALAERAEAERKRHAAVDIAFDTVYNDGHVAGGILAGALAYRMFIWLLPAALVAVAGLGVASDAAGKSPTEAANTSGLAGLVTSSVSSAAESPTRWYALVIGIPVLVYMTRSLLRTLIAAHRLVWVDIAARGRKPKLGPTLQLLAVLIGYFAASAIAAAARDRWGAAGLLATLFVVVIYVLLWLLVSVRLPHGDATWPELVPGAVLVGVGIEAMHVVTAYYIGPEAGRKQSTYGSLGLAAALLLGLYIIGRLIVGAAVLNATLHARRTRPDPPAP
jgi:uncharacterized BrkB/YihY/UPF0761 family membrane protein